MSEGYVVEYADGTLQANPYLPKPKDKAQAADPEAEAAKAGDEPIIATKEKSENAEESPAEKSAEEPAPAEPSESAAGPAAETRAEEAETPASDGAKTPSDSSESAANAEGAGKEENPDGKTSD